MRDQFALALQSDTIEVADVVRALKRQWRAIAACTALGVLAATAIILFAPRRYDGKATVLARTSGAAGGSVLGRMSGVGELISGMGGLGTASSMETELQVLKSGVLAGQVVDSLQLQFSVREPAGTAPSSIVQAHDLVPSFAPRKYAFERIANGSYKVVGDTATRIAVPGHTVHLDVGTITLQASSLPSVFVLRVFDREDAIARVQRRMQTAKAGGEIARIAYRGDDPVTAAAVPNSVVRFYLERRKTVDRGTNQRRLEYVTAQLERTAADLSKAERDLRHYQEATQVFDAEISDKAHIESAAKLRESLIQLQVDEGGLKQLLAQTDQGTLTSREIAAYPSFIRGSSVSPLVQQLSELEVQRTRLLERRTERDPEILALDKSIAMVNGSIVIMARSYAQSLAKQRTVFEARLDTVQQTIQALPAAGERVGRLKRDVLRLTQLYTALQAQLVEARLAAISEGGDVRQIDVAAAPKGPAFPNPIVTMGVGTAGGLVVGMIVALFLGWFGRWLRDPSEVERLTGISAQRLHASAPLVVGSGAPHTVLVVPLDERADAQAVAERLARTASARSLPVTILDLSGKGAGNGNGRVVGSSGEFLKNIDQLEQQQGMLVVQLPTLASDATVAALRETRPVVLVAPPGPVDRVRLAAAVDMLRRLQVPCAGVVMSDRLERRRDRALV